MAPTLASTMAPSATITEFTSTSSPLPSLVAELQAELQASIKERRSGDIERMILALLFVVCVCIICFLVGNKFGNERARKAKQDAEAAAGSEGVEMTEIESPQGMREIRANIVQLQRRLQECRMREQACPNRAAHSGPFLQEHLPEGPVMTRAGLSRSPAMTGALAENAARAGPSQPASPAPGARAAPAERSIVPTEPKSKKPKGWWGKLAGNMVGAFAGSGSKPKERSAKQRDVPNEPERNTGGPDDDAFGIVSDSELSEYDEPPKGYVPHGTVPKLKDLRSGVEMNGPDPRLVQSYQASICNVEDLDRESVAGSGSLRSRRASGLRSVKSRAHSLASEAAPLPGLQEGEEEDKGDELSDVPSDENGGPVQPKETL